MPYLPPVSRTRLDAADTLPETSGELNYIITALCIDYLSRKGLCYDTINEIVGALECARLEFYRRVASPYEDSKADINGDVYAAAGRR